LPSGRNQGVADKPTRTTTAGLDAELTESRDGTWTIVLRDDQATEVHRKAGYKDPRSAQAAAYQWVRRHYQVEAKEVLGLPEPPAKKKPKRASPHTRKLPSSAHLSRLLLLRADGNEEQAIQLRTKADALEAEAKRLREVADALGDSDGS
jgi:hypothetical protein